jgi:CBS domain-containing protein
VVDEGGKLLGVLTRRNLLDPEAAGARPLADLLTRPPAAVFEDSSLREAADHMVREDVGRLPVVARGAPETVLGFITRGDLLAAHRSRLAAAHEAAPGMFPSRRPRGASER